MTAKLPWLVAASLLLANVPPIGANASTSDLARLSKTLMGVRSHLRSQPKPSAAELQNPANMSTQDMEAVVEKLVLQKSEPGASSDAAKYSVKTIKFLLDTIMFPKTKEAHETDENELKKLMGEVAQCDDNRKTGLSAAVEKKHIYEKQSPQHKVCRGVEAVLSTERESCWSILKDKQALKDLKCAEFSKVANKVSDENAIKSIVTKAGSEAVESYVTRITGTICGTAAVHDGKARADDTPAMFNEFQAAKTRCAAATEKVKILKNECAEKEKKYFDKKKECDNIQDQMDGAACKRAVLVKDSCEAYAECHHSKMEAFTTARSLVEKQEKDRQSEWRALKRMSCYIDAFEDGKVEDSEAEECKNKDHDTDHLIVKYPEYAISTSCTIPDLYPSTAEYKQKEFAPLPARAKGKVALECVGVLEINTKPKTGSPATCKCERVTMNGHYSAGPMVKCTKCLDVRRSHEKNSCPDGTKLFSPRSRTDWQTFINSAGSLRDPHFIIDVTRPANGCGEGCTSYAMNSGVRQQSTWRTADGSAWWLSNSRYTQPNGDYHANCYMDLWHPLTDANHVTFNDGSCAYHSASYFCQPVVMSMTPKTGSPSSCRCEKVVLSGTYSAGSILRCTECLDVRRSEDVNSCPEGTKIFSPATREDWTTFLDSAQPLRSPNWIIDITRPQNGCGGCAEYEMSSTNPNQATWRTEDASPWWLRSTKIASLEPSEDYKANCYLDLTPPAPSTADALTFDADDCHYHSNSYYCQPNLNHYQHATYQAERARELSSR